MKAQKYKSQTVRANELEKFNQHLLKKNGELQQQIAQEKKKNTRKTK